MADTTGIQWCDATFNPWVGCEKVSPGCAHCYAETLVTGRMARPGTWGADGVRQVTSDSNWKKPLRWARLAAQGLLPNGNENRDGHRPRIFCASLADVFEPRAELDEPRRRLFDLIGETPELDWLLLTKRPEVALVDVIFDWGSAPPNVWMGTSVENSRYTWRADVLREIPAAVRFISAEPLLGSLFDVAPHHETVGVTHGPEFGDPRTRKPLDLTGIDWVIIGGESGPGARPFYLEHAREIIDRRALMAGAVETLPAIFVKQLGKLPTATWEHQGRRSCRQFGISHPKGGDLSEWPEDLRIREFPKSAVIA